MGIESTAGVTSTTAGVGTPMTEALSHTVTGLLLTGTEVARLEQATAALTGSARVATRPCRLTDCAGVEDAVAPTGLQTVFKPGSHEDDLTDTQGQWTDLRPRSSPETVEASRKPLEEPS